MHSSTTAANPVALPPRFTPYEPTAVVALPAVAMRFGYASSVYFRRHIAPRLGLEFRQHHRRYTATGAAVNAAIHRFLTGEAR
jgi:hypothetical protein